MRTNRDTPNLDDLYRRLACERMKEVRKVRYADAWKDVIEKVTAQDSDS